MKAARLFLMSAAAFAAATPLSSHADGVAAASAATCAAAPMTHLERRLVEKSAGGQAALIGYVHISEPIHHVRVDEAFALVEAARMRQAACTASIAAPLAGG